MKSLTVFIGSSSENKIIGKWIQDILLEIDQDSNETKIKSMGWWENSSFPFGKSFFESLLDLTEKTDCAIMIAAAEDLTKKRENIEFQPRDNIILEIGLFAGKHGKEQALIVQADNPVLPSDLNGIATLKLKNLDSEEDFKKSNRASLNNWIHQVLSNKNKSEKISIQFPKLYKSIINTIKESKTENRISNNQNIDLMASNIFTRISSILDDETYIADFLVNEISREIEDCHSILATDVLGPSAWVSPTAFRYLAIQIKNYIRRNIVGNNWNLIVDEKLGQGIEKACLNVRELTGVGESFSLFDNPRDFHWETGKTNLQFARILLWSTEELLSPIGESIIEIHQAFNVPLFFLEVNMDDVRRNSDYIIFEKENGEVTGFYNSSDNQYKPRRITNGGIPFVKNCKEDFANLIKNNDIMFAIDARNIAQFKKP